MSNYDLIKMKFDSSLSYEEYFENFKDKIEGKDLSSLTDFEKDNFDYMKLNFQRSLRIHKTYTPSKEIKEIVSQIKNEQLWIIITEEWCGDSAQNIPYIFEISKLNPLIKLSIFKRDSNLEIMDLYLTNGTRSIPKLIAFNKNGKELFTWGARPKEAQELVNQLKSEGKSKDEFIEQLHLWYAKNKGKDLENELSKLILSVI